MKHFRQSPRASWHDYTSQGGYFVTICCKDRISYFGEIKNGVMHRNEIGEQTIICRKQINLFHPHVTCMDFVCMPNHIHGILYLGIAVGTHYMRPNEMNVDACNASLQPYEQNIYRNASLQQYEQNIYRNASLQQYEQNIYRNASLQSESLGSIIRGFKIGITKFAKQSKLPFAWQGRYHDHIIRDKSEYERIKYYIQNNPQNRHKDSLL